ncbi:hypothetical protein AGOR_G00132770 [Albula goreensis]|uniref:Uncharacterized protein n=1 Tax=Albula goreensis TaxID=1534307 RepID=A0A8T3D8B9_9TELE|nr:hypothetical protein AGOR_G00132770 [Albula goreensis]
MFPQKRVNECRCVWKDTDCRLSYVCAPPAGVSVMGFPDPALAQAAERMVRDHQSRFTQTGRVLQQRQTIQLVPISRVCYMWKGESYMYIVYGQENKVNMDNYPATCCCCSII